MGNAQSPEQTRVKMGLQRGLGAGGGEHGRGRRVFQSVFTLISTTKHFPVGQGTQLLCFLRPGLKLSAEQMTAATVTVLVAMSML